MSVLKSLKWRYATKKFDPERKLSADQIDILKQAFNLTATSYGLQPLSMLIIENRELREELIQYSWGQRQVADASHLLVICVHTDISEEEIVTYFERVKHIRETPDDILHPFRESLIKDFKNKSTHEIENWATKQAYLALGNLLTVCAVEEIDSCPMEGFMPDQYDKVLELEKRGLRAVLALPVGYRSGDDIFASLRKVRKELHDSIIEIK